ncbi:MAG: response regulator [Pirellulaceae bacterium]
MLLHSKIGIMHPDESFVCIVDDDDAVRMSLGNLFRAHGYRVKLFSLAKEFLDQLVAEPACLILDLEMPGLNGFDLQAQLRDRGMDVPTIILTGHGDVPRSVRAMKAGATDFISKPFDTNQLLESVERAMIEDREPRLRRAERRQVDARIALLTKREREVMMLVVAGLLNKQIAHQLGAAEKTIKVHRGRVMQKMQAESVADLVRMAERVGIAFPLDSNAKSALVD